MVKYFNKLPKFITFYSIVLINQNGYTLEMIISKAKLHVP